MRCACAAAALCPAHAAVHPQMPCWWAVGWQRRVPSEAVGGPCALMALQRGHARRRPRVVACRRLVPPDYMARYRPMQVAARAVPAGALPRPFDIWDGPTLHPPMALHPLSLLLRSAPPPPQHFPPSPFRPSPPPSPPCPQGPYRKSRCPTGPSHRSRARRPFYNKELRGIRHFAPGVCQDLQSNFARGGGGSTLLPKRHRSRIRPSGRRPLSTSNHCRCIVRLHRTPVGPCEQTEGLCGA